MAYMSQEKKNQLAPGIKAILKKYQLKGSISVKNHSTLCVTISAGKIDFLGNYKYLQENQYSIQVNEYSIEDSYTGIARQALLELKDAINAGNYNHSDVQSDYFDVGFYTDICIGTYDKPYKLIE